jgi:hypothetical protein
MESLALRLDDQATGSWILGVPYQLERREGKLTRVYLSLPARDEEKEKFLCLSEHLPLRVDMTPLGSGLFMEGKETFISESSSDYRVKIRSPLVSPDPFYFQYQFLNLFSERWYPMFEPKKSVNLSEWFSREHTVKSNLLRVIEHDPFTSLRASIDTMAQRGTILVNQFLVYLVGHPERYLDLITTVKEPPNDAVTTGVRIRCSENQFQFSIRVVNSHAEESVSDLWLRCENDPLLSRLLKDVPEATDKQVGVSIPKGLYPDEVLAQMFFYDYAEVEVLKKGFEVRDLQGEVTVFSIPDNFQEKTRTREERRAVEKLISPSPSRSQLTQPIMSDLDPQELISVSYRTSIPASPENHLVAYVLRARQDLIPGFEIHNTTEEGDIFHFTGRPEEEKYLELKGRCLVPKCELSTLGHYGDYVRGEVWQQCPLHRETRIEEKWLRSREEELNTLLPVVSFPDQFTFDFHSFRPGVSNMTVTFTRVSSPEEKIHVHDVEILTVTRVRAKEEIPEKFWDEVGIINETEPQHLLEDHYTQGTLRYAGEEYLFVHGFPRDVFGVVYTREEELVCRIGVHGEDHPVQQWYEKYSEVLQNRLLQYDPLPGEVNQEEDE